ncbi:hypothetical protein QYF61_024899 [Mycteria americana]|uniref:F5/8 type C domain-containing protein n=1 Tax=Mycteria americana TaxID=33587 RepID=A0AAN7NTB2_MYCAM|nr:hypothetical protein QYF61_024899 [Mycteria americana]
MEGGAISDAQLSASSVHYGFLGLQRWGPELARLNNHGIVNAWTSSNYDKNPWIQANLLRKMRLSGIITQGARRVGQPEYVRAYKVAYSLDGREFTFCKDEKQDTDKVFQGNVDYGTMQTNMFNPPITAQFIRIYPVMCRRACTLRFELIGCEMNVYFNTAGCSEPLGMKSRLISDQQITASSVFKTWGIDAFTWHPHYARLDKTGKTNAWTALHNGQSEWLQLLQLCPGPPPVPGATSCTRAAGSRTGTAGEARQDCARIVQPEPCRWGTQLGGALPELGSQGQARMGPQPPVLTVMLERGVRNISACRDRDRAMLSPQSFLWGALSLQHPSSASTPWEPPSWPEIDLRDQKKVTGIITQGARDFGHIQYVAAYKVAYSDNGTSWTLYRDGQTNSTKIFHGNSDNYSHKKNVFDVPFYARFVRILPVAWHNRITLRVELLGCDE